MPNVMLTLPETAETVFRPVVFSIIDQLQEVTKITKNAKIIFPGDLGKQQNTGSSIDDSSARTAILGSNRMVFIEVEEDYDHESIFTTATSQPEHLCVFYDEAIGVYISPIYCTSNLKINFRYRTPSKTEALRWRDDLRVRISHMREMNLHTLKYHFPIPTPYLKLIKTIHELRENVDGYNDTLEEYLLSNGTTRLGLTADISGENISLVISESQSRVVGLFDFDLVPEKPEKDDSNGCWTVSFSYNLSYQKPIAISAKYPVMVHNQLMPDEYIVTDKTPIDVDDRDLSFSNSIGALNYFESPKYLRNIIEPGKTIRLPEFDEFNPSSIVAGTGEVFTALCEIDIETKKDLLNLHELGDFVIDDDVMEFLTESEYPFITTTFGSIIQVSLYRGQHIAGDRSLVCDKDLNIRSLVPMNLRLHNRIRFSVVTDLTLLSQAAIDRLKLYPKAFIKIMSAINEILANHPGMHELGLKRYITTRDFSAIYRFITGVTYNGDKRMKPYSPGVGKPQVTVGKFNQLDGSPTGDLYHPLDPLKDIRGMTLDEILRLNRNGKMQTVMTSAIITYEK